MTPDRAFEQHYLEVYYGEVCLLLIYWVEFHVVKQQGTERCQNNV